MDSLSCFYSTIVHVVTSRRQCVVHCSGSRHTLHLVADNFSSRCIVAMTHCQDLHMCRCHALVKSMCRWPNKIVHPQICYPRLGSIIIIMESFSLVDYGFILLVTILWFIFSILVSYSM